MYECRESIHSYYNGYTEYYGVGWDWDFKNLATKFNEDIQWNFFDEKEEDNLYGLILLGWDTVFEVMNESTTQFGPVITLTVFCLLALFPIVVLLWRFFRCCNTGIIPDLEKKQVPPLNRRAWALRSAVYLVLFLFLVTGMALFGSSMASLSYPLSISGLKYNVQGIARANQEGTREMNCYTEIVNSIFGNASVLSAAGPVDNLNYWMDTNGVTPLENFDEVNLQVSYGDLENEAISLINDLQNLQTGPLLTANGVCNAEMQQILSQLQRVYKVLQQLIQIMMPIIENSNATITETKKKHDLFLSHLNVPADSLSTRLSVSSRNITAVITSTTNVALYDNNLATQLTEFFGNAANALQSNYYDIVTVFVYILVYVPSSVVALSLLVGFEISVYSVVVTKCDLSRIVQISRFVLRIGSFAALFSAWYLFVMVIVIFWFSNGFTAVCPFVFGGYLFDYDWPLIQYTNFAGDPLSEPYRDYRQSLPSAESVYSNLNEGRDALMSAREIELYIDIPTSQKESDYLVSNFNLSCSFDVFLSDKFKVLADLLQSEKDELELTNDFSSCPTTVDFTNFKNNISRFQNNLSRISANSNDLAGILETVSNYDSEKQESTRTTILNNNDSYFNETSISIWATVNALLDGLIYSAWSANAQVGMYVNSGVPVCIGFRYSVNGVWASIFWIAIFMLPAAFILRYTAGKLIEQKLLDQVPTSVEPIPYENIQESVTLDDLTMIPSGNSVEQPEATSTEIFTITSQDNSSLTEEDRLPRLEETPDDDKTSEVWG